MGTLSDGGRITTDIVKEEILRLTKKWGHKRSEEQSPQKVIENILGKDSCNNMDLYDQIKLAGLIETCQKSQSMAEASRKLFNSSREIKKSKNDSHRVKQLLAKHGLQFADLKQ